MSYTIDTSDSIINRRFFLVWLLSLTGVAAGCAGQPDATPTDTPKLAQSPLPSATMPLPSTASVTPPPTPTQLPPTLSATPPSPTLPPTALPPTLPATPPPTPLPAISRPLDIIQPATPGPEAFIQYAFEMRRLAVEGGDQSFGAIIVKENRVVGLGPSRVVVNRDPTAHAEMEAIRDACRRLGTTDLSGCVMYSTFRPCRMCETAAYWARLGRMYYSASITDGGTPQYCNC